MKHIVIFYPKNGEPVIKGERDNKRAATALADEVKGEPGDAVEIAKVVDRAVFEAETVVVRKRSVQAGDDAEKAETATPEAPATTPEAAQ
jgi:hypothetical protein